MKFHLLCLEKMELEWSLRVGRNDRFNYSVIHLKDVSLRSIYASLMLSSNLRGKMSFSCEQSRVLHG